MNRLFFLHKTERGFLLSASDKGKPYFVNVSDSPDSFDSALPPVKFIDNVLLDWNSDKRPFCHIFWDDNYTVVSVQELNAGASYNLRDLGGYLTASKDAVVKFGLLYRGDQPFSMGSDVSKIYNELGLKTVLDFRGGPEHKLWPDPEIDGVTNYWLPVIEENPTKPPEHVVVKDLSDIFKHDDQWKHEETVRFSESYLVMPFDNPAYKKMFSCLLNNDVPLLFHCLAGKDRTGIGAMLILLALGVSDETIMEDYKHRSADYQAYIDFRENELSEHLLTDISKKHFSFCFGVLEENLAGSLKKIHEDYASVDEFLLESYGLDKNDLDKLRSMYLLPIKS